MKPILTLLAMLLLAACSPKKPVQEEIVTIDLTGNLSRQKEFFLSDIASDIEYVKLDNSIEAAIQQADQYEVTTRYLLIYDRTRLKVLLFDRTGKFLRQIGRQGKGPGEYTQIQDVSMDPNEEFIYITHAKQINSYRITGEFVKATPLPSWALFAEPFGDDFLAVFPSYYSKLVDNFTFIFFKQDGAMGEKLLKRNWDFFKPGDPMKICRLYRYDGLWCFNESYYDTVFAITPDRKVVPRIHFIKDKSNSDPMTNTGYNLDGWKELPDYIFISGSKNRRMHTLVYDRKTRETWHVPYDTVTRSFGITNDLDGGLKFWRGLVVGDKIFTLDNGVRMKDGFDRISVRPFTARLPERRRQLEEFIANLKEDDNQILTIVTLKK